MRLFADVIGSPVPQQWEDNEITAVITPYSKADNSFDSGFKSQSDISVSIVLMFLLLICFGLLDLSHTATGWNIAEYAINAGYIFR